MMRSFSLDIIAPMNAPALNPAAAAVEQPLLARLPVTLFASVMGTAGLAVAWQRAAHVWALPVEVGHAIGALAAVLYLLLATVYLAKFLRHRAAVVGEWNHPVRAAMVPTTSIGLLLLAIVAVNAGLRGLAEVLWIVGTLAHLALTVAIVGRWLRHNTHEPAHANPAWFIPAVGNVLVPLAGVRLGYTEISWLFFGIGMGFWLALLPIVFARLVFAAELPARMRPLLFILIPPPAIGFLSYVALVGQIDAIAHVLYGFAAFLTLLLLAQGRWFSALPFFVSWWGYTFPLAAITVATLAMAQASGAAGYRWASAALLVLVSGVVTLVAVRTIAAFLRRDPHFME
jgi:tellurite resistance protein